MKPGLNDSALKRMASFRPKWAQEEVEGPEPEWERTDRDVSDEAAELKLYIDNDGDLYRQRTVPIMKNLMKKMKNGTFDPSLAVQGFMYLVDAGAQAYNREFGSDTKWHQMFPKETRQQVAQWLVDDFVAEAELGNYDQLLGKSGQVEDEKEDPEFDKSMDYADKLVKKIKKGQQSDPEGEWDYISPDDQALVSEVSTKLDFDLYRAAVFCIELLDDVNYHDLAETLRSSYKEKFDKDMSEYEGLPDGVYEK